MSRKLNVRRLEIERGQRIFCRVDYNVPIKDGKVGDDTRISASLPTLTLLSERGARTVLASHLGRPKGKAAPEFSLKPVADHLAVLLGKPVAFSSTCIGDDAERASREIEPGGFLVVENVRFHKEEEANDAAFSAALARLGDLYVNDAFGSAHRAHASTAGVPALLKPAAAGLLMEAELEHLGRLLENPESPFVAILGGAKVSDKIELIENLLPHVDLFLVGGAMAYTFLKAFMRPTGLSPIEEDRTTLAKALVQRARAAGKDFLLPVDHVVTVGGKDDVHHVTAGVDVVGDEAGVDIGPKTAELFASRIAQARTVLWNGPLGKFETEAFSHGTRKVAEALATSAAVSVVGGGDTASAVKKFGLTSRMTHVSTGGGASLEFLSGLPLPGVEALDDAS
ncbi:MAG: phosphoglycerate kinase [Acidobacteriia bacterium]|nr:phosphoglycerate kinase [Terriglobia bacterium]